MNLPYRNLRNLTKALAVVSMFGATPAATAAPEPYVYCLKDSCGTARGPTTFFFGTLPSGVITHCVEPHTYAMTFDDGPAGSYPKVLEILERKGVQATFFVIGSKVADDREQAYLKQAAAAGHQIANHTFTHRDLMGLSDGEILEEIKSTEEAIVKVLGDTPEVRREARVMRPPFGYIDQRVYEVLAKNGNLVVRWNTDRSDWELDEAGGDLGVKRLDQHLAYAQSQNVLGVSDSMIDLNHDFSPATLSRLDVMIDKIRAKGYRFVKMDECLGR